MKKLIVAALSAAMALAMSGCVKQQQSAPEVSALSLMQQVNSKNIVNSASNMRIWYQINPALFADRATGQPGTLRSIVQDIEYLSDGDTETSDDLNMSGILLTDLISVDDSYAPRDFVTLNPNIGDDEDLQSLCTRANGLNLPIMITMDFASISQENEDFRRMIDLVNQNADNENLFELDPSLFGMFYVEKDKDGQDGWTKIGETAYSYQSLPQSGIPRINLENEAVRAMVINAVYHFMDLGVRGFYISDYSSLFPGDDQKAADFMNWLSQAVRDRDNTATVVFSYTSWNDPTGSVQAFTAPGDSIGAEGMLAKAATGAISARDLGAYLEQNYTRSGGMNASFVNTVNNTLDLLKVDNRLAQYKMTLALQLMTSGQVFILSGDELGLTSEQADFIVDAIEETPAEEDSGSDTGDSASDATQISLQFGSLPQQKKNGNSILNFVQQAVSLRDSYSSVAEGSMTWSQELSTDQVLVLDKRSSSSETVLVFNLSDQPQTLDTTPIKISNLPAELGGVLLTGVEDVTLKDNQLTLPPYSMALLK